MSTTITPTEQNIDINVTEDVIDINVTNNIVDVNATAQQINIEVAGAYPIPNPVLSVFGRTGAVVATEGDYSLTQLSDVTLSSPANGQVLKYNGTIWVNSSDADTGITTLNTLTALTQTFAVGTSGTDFNISSATSTHTFNFPTANATNRGLLSSANWSNFNTAYNDSIVSAAVTGTTTKTLTLTQQDAGTITASWTDINTDAVTSVFGRTGAVVATSGDYTTTQVTEGTNLYFTDARARAAISLTTTGTSGASTYNNTTGVLNIPQYQAALTNPVTGTGTTNTLPKFTAASTIGNSNITDTGSLITLGSNAYVNGSLGIGVQAPLAPLQLGNGYTDSAYDGFKTTGSPSLLIAYEQTSVIHRILGGVYSQAATVNLDLSLAISKNKGTGSGFRITSGVGTGVGTSNNYLSFSSLIGASDETFTATEYMRLDANGALGIGTTSLTGYNLRVAKNLTGATVAYGIAQTGSVQSDVTSVLYNFYSQINTAAASFTLGDYVHFMADNSISLGAGSSVTRQYGFLAQSSLTSAGTNYGFFGAIPSGTNRWNLYMNGTANNYLAGALGIGSTGLTGYNLRISINPSSATAYGIMQDGLALSSVTTSYHINRTLAQTQAATFTLPELVHYYATQGTFGAGSTVGNQYGFIVGNLTGATNNYGFYGNIVSGTNRWNLYMNGSANNYLEGDTAIGTTTFGTATKFTLGGSETASSAIARGQLITSTLVAAANNDVLVGLDINPTFTNGAFTGVVNYGIRYNSSSAITPFYFQSTVNGTAYTTNTIGGNNIFTIASKDVLTATLNLLNGSNGASFYAYNNILTLDRIGTNSFIRILNQNVAINSNTDAGFRLDVNGTARVQSTLLSGGGTPLVLTGESFAFQSIVSSGAGGAVIGTNASNPAFIDILSGNNFWHISHRSSGNANRLGIYNASFTGTTATYTSELLTISTTGSVGIGSTSLTNVSLSIGKNITGSAASYGMLQTGVVQSDSTTFARYFGTSASTAAASFTVSDLVHYYSGQGSFGAGSVVTNQYGFFVSSALISATNNFGFYSNIASGTNRWNLYMAGTAANYMAGSLGIGSTIIETKLDIDISNTSTSVAFGNSIKVENTDTTVGNLSSLMLSQSGDAAATIAGIHTSRTPGSRTSDLGLYSYQQSGSGITERVRIKSTGQMRFVPLTADPSGAQAGDVYYNSTTNKLKVYNGTAWETITSA